MKHGTAAAGEVIGLAVKTVLCGNLLGRGGRGVVNDNNITLFNDLIPVWV